MALLRPLLLDNVPSIQQSAALALGRLANYSDELAEAVVSNEILPQLVYSLSEQNVSSHSLLAQARLKDLNLKIFVTFIEILQEGRCLRSQICCQALSPSCQSCRSLRCPRCSCQLPWGVWPLSQGGRRSRSFMRRQAQRWPRSVCCRCWCRWTPCPLRSRTRTYP